MREPWLQPNRRALWFGCLPPSAVAALGAWMTLVNWSGDFVWLRWLGMALFALAIATLMLLLRQLWRPRIAYRDGHVLFYLRPGRPLAVPVDVIEAFFIGQGPACLPANIPQHQQSLNLVARISRRAADWAERDVKPALGNWRDGYVTIRGAWCEPLNVELIRRLNRRLKEVHQQKA